MATLYKPLADNTHDETRVNVFLAGSIEMGTAVDWQSKVFDRLDGIDCDVYNPRRDDWDSSWTQSINDKNFNDQVTWELDHIESADIVMFHFDPETKSPISLLEIGFACTLGSKLFVCCPDGFWRKGNIEVLCDRYSIPLYNDIDSCLDDMVEYLNTYEKSEEEVMVVHNPLTFSAFIDK